MAWTSPRTWVTSELVTAAIMNTHVRDNLRELWREIEVVGPAGGSSTPGNTGGPVLVVGLSTRTYAAGVPIKIEFSATAIYNTGATGGAWMIGITDGTPGGGGYPSAALRPLGKGSDPTDMEGVSVGSGTWSYRFVPSAGSHTYQVWLWGGNGVGTDVTVVDAGAFIRLLERGG